MIVNLTENVIKSIAHALDVLRNQEYPAYEDDQEFLKLEATLKMHLSAEEFSKVSCGIRNGKNLLQCNR